MRSTGQGRWDVAGSGPAQCMGVAVGPDEEGGLREKEDWRSQEAQSVLAHNV